MSVAKILDIVRAFEICIIGHHEFGLAYLDLACVVGVPALYYRYHNNFSIPREGSDPFLQC